VGYGQAHISLFSFMLPKIGLWNFLTLALSLFAQGQAPTAPIAAYANGLKKIAKWGPECS
jgi:hypothetical protein